MCVCVCASVCVCVPVSLSESYLCCSTLDAMVSLIRIFHYERPFDPEDPGKRCAPEVKPLLRGLYDDVTVMATVQRVKRMFVEDKECLIHGDLHVDSVIVKDDDFKVIQNTRLTLQGLPSATRGWG